MVILRPITLESQPYTSNMLGKMSTKSEDKPTEHVKYSSKEKTKSIEMRLWKKKMVGTSHVISRMIPSKINTPWVIELYDF